MAEISKAYEPQSVEDRWYQFWLDGKFFAADAQSPKPAYSIVIPPPNVTGVLTMGHVLNNTIQDILARKARMDGKEVLWLPGTDHAGIATQTVVERTLKKSGEIRHRDDLGREKFLERVWQWKEKHGGIIINQLKKLGASCDWSRERFTMDPEYSRCVQKVFVELYKKGLIYRGKRMVNWCPASLTALSDEEVIMKEQKGSLYYFKVQVVESPLTPTGRVSGNEPLNLPLAGGFPQNSLHPLAVPSPLPSDGRGEGQGEVRVHEKFGPVTDSEGRIWLTIATTRPETIPGDAAVAVNPKDPRYAKFIGKYVVRPLPAELPREQKLIPIIGDEHVDFEFGTGVLKVTPAHDKADFDIMARYTCQWLDKNPLKSLSPNATAEERIEFYNIASKREHLIDYRPEVIDEKGIMTQAAGKELVGLDRFKARKVAVGQLAEFGFLEKEEPYTNKVGFSERADVPIEPRLSEQWFLEYPRWKESFEAVMGNKIMFHPYRWRLVYGHWMDNLKDWCVSRQLWWGHRIPVWSGFLNPKNHLDIIPQTEISKLNSWMAGFPPNPIDRKKYPGIEVSLSGKEGHTTFIRLPHEKFSWNNQKGYLIVAATISEIEAQKLEDLGLVQDPDVLDTWFSSWLWPFATMGWPEQTPTLKKFYPTADLVTGPDIIFFWVARMIMAGYEFMGEMPFKNVYFTGIIRDKQGRKMSKSLGNSPDPLDLIAKYGADALRFGVMRAAPLGQDILFDEQNVELGRNFCNKLWNACRFRQLVGQASSLSPSDSETASKHETGATPVLRYEVQGEIDPKLLTSDDKWILLKLDTAIREMNTAFAEYKFSDATATLYRFFWSEYCDWYVEASKAALAEDDAARKANTLAVIDFVLSHTLRLFHPFLPFITEELWHGMDYAGDMPDNQGGKTIMFAPWPKPLDDDFKEHYGLTDAGNQLADAKYELVSLGRNLRREFNIQANKKIKFILKPAGQLSALDAEVMKLLLNAESVELKAEFTLPKGTPMVANALGELFLPLEGLVDVAAEKARLIKEQEKIETEIAKVGQKLSNPNFAQKVPPQVLEEHKQRMADWQTKLAQVEAALAALN